MSDTAIDAVAIAGRPPDYSRFGSLWALLQAELSSYPGRPLLVFRIVLSCTLVMFCILVFRIPGAALGAYYPLLVSRDNLHSTRRSAVWIAATCVLGSVEVVLGAMLFIGSPFLHLAWVCASLGAVFYLISSLKVYEAALASGLFIANTITTWDQPVAADWRLRQTLFTLLAILIGCAASVLIEYLFSRTHPPDAVIGGIQQRLYLIGEILQGYVNGKPVRMKLVHEVRRSSGRGTGALRELVSQAGYSFEEQQRLSTAVALAGRLIDLAATLTETGHTLSAHDRELCAVIGQNVVLIRGSLSRREIPEWIDIDGKYETGTPILIEIERTVDLLAESLSQPMWDGSEQNLGHHVPEPSRRIFAADAFSSKEHAKFAIRGGVSAIACYMFYMSVGWIGLSASVTTCILTALPITGAARHKQLMRFAGVVLGACAIGFTAQTLILPQIDSIFSYTLLFASVIFLGAWIATSGPRIAYCGAQIVLAYELVNLNRFSINPSLVPARDTVLGIVLGIGAMWLIFDHLWATSSTRSLRSMLGATIREIAELEVASTEQAEQAGDVLLERRTNEIMENFEKLRTLVDVSIFEAFPKAMPDEVLLQRTRDYLPQLRAALLIKTGLIHHRTVSGNQCRSDIAVQVQQRCSELLVETARHVEADSPDIRVAQAAVDHQIQQRLRSDADLIRTGGLECDLTELRLCSSLFNVVRHLISTT
ncbi:FUSC family protein [Edaphobacter bradus]|uniref:FUSC family protein n=1 Tax=Edaphobacter bradus TaxID=2259016 RepID=UPI0021DFAC1C|nr:FUSC family protein [Edaphobacter bradus]